MSLERSPLGVHNNGSSIGPSCKQLYKIPFKSIAMDKGSADPIQITIILVRTLRILCLDGTIHSSIGTWYEVGTHPYTPFAPYYWSICDIVSLCSRKK